MRLGVTSIAVITAATLVDDYHNEELDWSSATSSPVFGCSVQPGGGTQDVTNREAITTLYTVWAPLGTLVADVNRVAYSGVVYDIDGPIERWETGDRLDHLVLRLKAVAG